jgi:predicted transcriptional regulator
VSVHEAITSHVKKQNSHLEQFLKLEAKREEAIDQAVAACAAGQAFTVDRINYWTAQINAHAMKGISPTRSQVTVQMVCDYVSKKSQ